MSVGWLSLPQSSVRQTGLLAAQPTHSIVLGLHKEYAAYKAVLRNITHSQLTVRHAAAALPTRRHGSTNLPTDFCLFVSPLVSFNSAVPNCDQS